MPEPQRLAPGDVVERGERVLMATYSRHPVTFVSGAGCWLSDESGRRYLDFLSGIAVNALGHGHPAVTGALRQAADGLLHVSNLYYSEPMVGLAERLTGAAGMQRVFFCNSGAEAAEAAIKLARRARPERSRLICFERSFHGRTLGALSLTAQPAYQNPFQPLLPDVQVLPFGDFEAVDRLLDDATALVTVEVVQGEGGLRPAPRGWLAHLRGRCDAVGALLAFDEVQCGMGRTGALFAWQQDGIAPDMMMVAKALAGGLPMGALLARGAAADALSPGDHGCTFGGGPLLSTVALAVLETILADGFLAGVKARGAHLRSGLEALAAEHPRVSGVRGRGLMQGLVLDGPWAGALARELLQRGLLAAPAGGDVLRLLPPLIVTDDEIEQALTRLRAGLDACAIDDGAAGGRP